MDFAPTLAVIGSAVGVTGGVMGLMTAWANFRWKRAEIATGLLRDFNANDELVFASRCLDWNGGRLVVPVALRPLMTKQLAMIDHDRRLFERSLIPDLTIDDLNADPRIQIYRTAIDSLLSWLVLVSSGMKRRLFRASDIEEAGYWVAKFQADHAVRPFIVAFGYKPILDQLEERFRKEKTLYASWFERDVPRDGPMSSLRPTAS